MLKSYLQNREPNFVNTTLILISLLIGLQLFM